MTVQAQLLPGAFGNDPVISPFEGVIEASGWTIMESANKPDAKRLSLLTRDNPMSVPGATATEATSFLLTTYRPYCGHSPGRIVVSTALSTSH